MVGQALRRDGAQPGDDVWLSGCTGEAGVGLAALRGEASLDPVDEVRCRERLEQPQPRVALGFALAGLATSAIDVSDGLVADLGHIATRSACGIDVHWARVPQSSALAGIDAAHRAAAILAGGDDYELAFTASPANRDAVKAAAREAGVTVTRIGEAVAGQTGVRVLDRGGIDITPVGGGFDHFG